MQDSNMKLSNKFDETKSISIFVRISPTLNAKLDKLAKRLGPTWGVATVMRHICEQAIKDGISIEDDSEEPPPRSSKKKINARAEAEAD